MKTKDPKVSTESFSCQKCSEMFESETVRWDDFSNKSRYVSPICNVCLLKLIKRIGKSIKNKLWGKSLFLERRHFPNLYKICLSSPMVWGKGQKRKLINFDPCPSTQEIKGKFTCVYSIDAIALNVLGECKYG